MVDMTRLSGEHYPVRGKPALRRESWIATFRRMLAGPCRSRAGGTDLDAAQRIDAYSFHRIARRRCGKLRQRARVQLGNALLQVQSLAP